MKDSWCRPVWDGEKWVYGGAARNIRIARNGGMDAIIERAMRKFAIEVEATVSTANGAIAQVVPTRTRRTRPQRRAA